MRKLTGHWVMVNTRRKLQILAIAGCVALVTRFAWTAVRHGYGFSDTLACRLTTGRHTTRYAAGYSETAFAQLRTGMTREEVLGRLGQPLERITYPSAWPEMDWTYSQPASRSGHFHLRAVRFAPDGKVSDVFKRFHFD